MEKVNEKCHFSLNKSFMLRLYDFLKDQQTSKERKYQQRFLVFRVFYFLLFSTTLHLDVN